MSVSDFSSAYEPQIMKQSVRLMLQQQPTVKRKKEAEQKCI